MNGNYKLGTRARARVGKCKLGAGSGKYKLKTGVTKNNLGARTRNQGQGWRSNMRVGGQEIQIPSFLK